MRSFAILMHHFRHAKCQKIKYTATFSISKHTPTSTILQSHFAAKDLVTLIRKQQQRLLFCFGANFRICGVILEQQVGNEPEQTAFACFLFVKLNFYCKCLCAKWTIKSSRQLLLRHFSADIFQKMWIQRKRTPLHAKN